MYPKKFGVDLRYVEYSALVCSGQLTKEKTWQLIHRPPEIESEIIDEVKNRLHLSGDKFEEILHSPRKTYKDYKNYLFDFKKRLPKYWKAVEDGILPFTFVNRIKNEKGCGEVAYA